MSSHASVSGPTNPAKELRSLLRARHECVRIVTSEEHEALELAINAAIDLKREAFTWSVTSGVCRADWQERQRVDNGANPAASLKWWIDNVREPSVLVTLDLADQLTDSVNLRATRDVIMGIRSRNGATGVPFSQAPGASALIMIDHHDQLPSVVGSHSVRLDIPPPDDGEIEEIVRGAIAKMSRDRPVQATVSRQFLRTLVVNLRGLNRSQVAKLICECVTDDHALNEADLARVQRGKRKLLEDSGVLEFVDAPASLDDIGGLKNLKSWLARRETLFADPAQSPPRGVLLLGVQGAGKSLASKAIATAWKRPLMRLDPGALFNKYVGETERNLREALRQAEAMAPVVLWIDEIEKGFASAASSSNDGGVTRRMFGSLLTWMQEHRSQVFLVATANDIEALPPELLRKGRFDEIFFVDLPTPEVREIIFAIHLRKRGYDPKQFDLPALAGATEGYSGAEIEQAVLSAHIDARHEDKVLSGAMVVDAARRSPPLSVTMREKIAWLRDWSNGRCTPAD